MTDTLTRAGFDIDLRTIGEPGEGLLREILLQDYPLIECKTDLRCQRWEGKPGTGNVFVEYKQPNYGREGHKPSGLAVTQSEYWATGLEDKTWVIVTTEKMRTLALRAYRERRVRQGGDGDNYRGILVPARWLLEYVAPEG